MKTIRSTYPALISILALVSCAQEEMIRRCTTGEDDTIIFRASLPSLSLTRDADVGDLSNGIHLTAFTLENSTTDGSDNTLVGVDGKLQEHFTKTIEGSGNVFTDPDCRWPKNRGEKEGQLEFFAFYPPLPESEAISENMPNLENNSKVENDVTTIDYKLKNFRIAKDMSEQVDFMTAHNTGSKTKNYFSEVNLEFQHQLSRVVLHAWGSNSNYNVEIAGVRIGGVFTKADFNFKGNSEDKGSWETGDSSERDCVEYIFREGDTVFTINKDQHNEETTAASIMGNVEWGMVIPSEQSPWDHKNDISNEKGGTYFSVLLRVADKVGKRLYPYPDNSDNMTVIYFAVHNSGKIISRLYPGDEPNTFLTEQQQPYTPNEDEEIKDFGWATVPCQTSWQPGFQYTYKLDYSEGVGVHDPQDPNPGKPIMFNVKIGDATITNWKTTDLVSEAVSE